MCRDDKESMAGVWLTTNEMNWNHTHTYIYTLQGCKACHASTIFNTQKERCLFKRMNAPGSSMKETSSRTSTDCDKVRNVLYDMLFRNELDKSNRPQSKRLWRWPDGKYLGSCEERIQFEHLLWNGTLALGLFILYIFIRVLNQLFAEWTEAFLQRADT
jgi:hypothetical protein